MGFKVIAIDPKDKRCVAEYLFDTLKSATEFQLGMFKKGYQTDIIRVNL